MAEHIEMSRWGKDHWSVLAYVECRCVDHKGVPCLSHMRCDPDIHPGLANQGNRLSPDKRYPTRLKGGVEVSGHDDWSCVGDMESEGLVEWKGTGIHPVFLLTEKGIKLSASLRVHKASGGSFGNFTGLG